MGEVVGRHNASGRVKYREEALAFWGDPGVAVGISILLHSLLGPVLIPLGAGALEGAAAAGGLAISMS
ncbi:MAG: hypothetical protein IT165_19750 [Bryobacterales bacterium]|nr:hypothetical protein [Bryobacterales bacterium]